MTNFGVAHLTNFWKIKDNCQEICSGLEILCEEAVESEKEALRNDYRTVQDIINQITATGYFNKAKDVESSLIVDMVNKIATIEENGKAVTAKVWARNLSKIDGFKQNSFKLCVKPFFETDVKKALSIKSSNFIQAHLISSGNIILNNQQVILEGKTSNILPYGFVYNVNETNFVGATDESSLLVLKNKNEITDKDYVAVASKGDEYVYLNGYATKLKTPGQIIRKYSNKRFAQNDNLVVLDGESSPVALFYYSLGIDALDPKVAEVKAVAAKMGLPVIAIDVEAFYRNNGKFFTTSKNIRTSFDSFVDSFNNVILACTGFDMLAESKKLIGYNTMLRYNFVYKFLSALQSKLNESSESLVDFVPKAFKKMVMKKNNLTKERELANGAPLVYPSENTVFAVPNNFFDAKC